MQFYLQEGEALRTAYHFVGKGSLQRPRAVGRADIGFVLLLVFIKILHQIVLRARGRSPRHRPIGFLQLTLADECVDTLQPLACLGKEQYPAHRPVQPMRHPQEDIARFLIPLLDIGLEKLAQRNITRLIPLHDLPGALVHRQEVVVFVEYVGGRFQHD